MDLSDEFESIREWAEKRGLYEKGDPRMQLIKLGEEYGELCQAMIKNQEVEMIDAIGDMVIVLTNLCEQMWGGDMQIEVCINNAYEEIKDRKGKMDNNTFVKE